MKGVTIVDHPLVQHKLTLMREKDTSIKSFRQLLKEIGGLVCYEVTRDLPLADGGDRDADAGHAGAASWRARSWSSPRSCAPAWACWTGCWTCVPAARVAHVGLYRDPATLECVEYYFKAPADMAERLVVVIDPMLATGNTAIAAVDRLKEAGAKADPHRLPAGLAGRHRQVPGHTIRASISGPRRWTTPERPRLHPARPRRRRRPDVRHALAVDISIDVVTLKPGFQHGDLPKFGMPLGG